MIQKMVSRLSPSASKVMSSIKKRVSRDFSNSDCETHKAQLQKTQKQLLETQIEMQKTHVEFSLFQQACRFEKQHLEPDYITGNPLVSIIIVNRDGLVNFKTLMSSFIEKTFYRNYEIICVDNGSNDGSPEYLESFRDQFRIRVIRNGENRSFSEANNIGVQHASGNYYLFLNNDISVEDHWLDELLHAVQTEPMAGAVGAHLIYPESNEEKKKQKSYAVQHAGIVFSDVIREDVHFIQPFNRRNGMPDRIHDGVNEHLAAVTAAVLLVSKEAFHKVAGFDEGYFYGYEDVDLCLKLTKAGYRNIYCPDSILFHNEFGTQKKDSSNEIYQRRLRNFRRFRERWNDYLADQLWKDKITGLHVFTDDPLKIIVLQINPVSAGQQNLFCIKDAEGDSHLSVQEKYYSYSQYNALARDDVSTDILVDPAGKYKNSEHRKAKRFVICRAEDIPSDVSPHLARILLAYLKNEYA